MALSGTVNGSVTHQPTSSNPFSFYFTWSASQNVANNYSDITVKTYWKTSNTAWTFDTVGTRNASITIAGTQTSIKKRFDCDPWSSNPFLIQTATTRVYHNADGTKSISISVRANGHASSWGPSSSTATSADCTASATITLDTIPRASSISAAGNVTLGNACSVKWTPASSSFKYKIKFTLGAWSHTTDYISPSTTNAYTYTGYIIPNISALLDDIPNSTTGTMTATLYTYNSSNTQIGAASSRTFTVTVPASVIPTVGAITLNPADINSQNILIQGKNKLTVSVSGCSAGTGSSIKSYTFSGPGISDTIPNTSVTSSGTISSTGSLTYTVTVTDNRGRTASKTSSITCYPYSAPKFTSFEAYRVASSTSTAVNDNGSYIRCTYTITYSYVNNTNTRKSFSITSGAGAVTYNTWSKNISGNVVTETGSAIIQGASNTSTYNVYATIQDNYGGNITSTTKTVLSAKRILNITPDGTGVAFGKMAEEVDCVDVPRLWSRGNIITKANQTGFFVTNKNGVAEPAIFKHSETFWIGSNSGTHISGSTHISAGDDVNGIYASKLVNDVRTDCLLLDTNNSPGVMPTTLYSTSAGNAGTITLSQSVANFNYLEIFYTDNATRQSNSIRVYAPNGKYVTLSCIEPSTSNSEPRLYVRSSGWTISGSSMTVGRTDLSGANRGVYGQLYPSAGGVGTNVDVKVTAENNIKIFRIVGYK